MDLHGFLETHRISARLDRIRLLAGLPAAIIREAEARCRWALFPAGTTIITEKDAGRDVVLVRHGIARVVQRTRSGREIAHADIGANGHFGELAAIDGGPRSADVVAQTDTVGALLAGDDFVTLLRRHPELALRVTRSLTAMVRGCNDRLRDLGGLPPSERVAGELLRLARQLAFTSNASRITIQQPPSARVLAKRAGTTRETVQRTLRSLMRQHLIQRVGESLEIFDVDRLERSIGRDE
jgi:CRP/FNR family cyclic AMP-dependent transcriptional regulator